MLQVLVEGEGGRNLRNGFKKHFYCEVATVSHEPNRASPGSTDSSCLASRHAVPRAGSLQAKDASKIAGF